MVEFDICEMNYEEISQVSGGPFILLAPLIIAVLEGAALGAGTYAVFKVAFDDK